MSTLHATLAYNTTTNIAVGNVNTDTGVILKFTARRGSLNCAGTIKVLPPYTDSVKTPPVVDLDPETGVGWTVTADYNLKQ